MTSPSRCPSSFEKNLPAPIVAMLHALAGRIRRVLLLRGLLAVLAAALATVLAMMAVDAAVVMFSAGPRVALSASGLGVVAAAVAWWVVRPLRRRISLAAIARIVERQHPEIQERISSVVELRGGSEIQGVDSAEELPRGSEQLIAAVTAEATEETGRIQPRREVSARSVRPYLLASLALAGVLALLFFLWPREVQLALARVLAPLANLDNLPAVALEVVPGDHVLAIGDPLSIRVCGPEGSMSDAELEQIDATGYIARKRGSPTAAPGDGRDEMVWHFPAVMDGFQYRVRAGRALSRYHQVTAVVRPKLESALVRYDYPDYARLPSRTVSELPRLIEALAGTQATLTVSANVRVARPQLHTVGTPVAEPEEAADPATGQYKYTWTFPIEPETSGLASIVLEEEHGIAGEPAEFEIHATADQRPTIAIVEPQGYKIALRPRDRLALKYHAEDDFGIGEVDMLVRVGADDPITIAQPTPGVDGKPVPACRGVALLELSRLDLAGASRVTVQMRAADTLPASRHGPNRAASLPLVIEIDRSGEKVARNDDGMSQELQQAQDRVESLREKAEQLRDLARQQEELAREAAAPDVEHLPNALWQEEQRELAEKLTEIVQRDPNALREELKAEQRQAAQLSQEARKLAEKEQWLQRQTQVASESQPDRKRWNRDILEELARQQQAIAEDTSKMHSESKSPTTPAAKELSAAGEAMKKAADAIDRQQVENAAADARHAQDRLAQAAAAESAALQAQPETSGKSDPGKLDPAVSNAAEPTPLSPAPVSPESPESAESAAKPAEQPSRAKRARALVARQESVARALEALKKSDAQEALIPMQQGVKEQAESLQERAAELAGRAAELGLPPKAREHGENASSALTQAAQSAAQAAELLSKAPASAMEPERRAERSLRNAADALGRLEEALRQQADPLPGEKDATPASPSAAMAAAFEEAAQSGRTRDAREASESAGEASRALGQAAAAAQRQARTEAAALAASAAKAGIAATAAGKTAATTSSPAASKSASRGPVASKAAAAGTTGGKTGKLSSPPGSKLEPVVVKPKSTDTDWVKFRGQVQREVGDRAAKDGDDEYRELVNRYFEELSRQGSKR